MKIGAIFPTTEIGTDPVVIRDWAQTAEQLGYDHVVIYDHVLGAEHEGRDPLLTGPYTEADPFHEPFVLLAYLAGFTTKLELVTGILVLPQRQTVLVAKQAAELDLLSGGRLRLGVGTGWNFVEYESLGMTFEDRGQRFDEQIDLLRKLWSQPVLDFDGRYHRIDRAGLLPLPGRKIPIWFGAFTEVALRRAAAGVGKHPQRNGAIVTRIHAGRSQPQAQIVVLGSSRAIASYRIDKERIGADVADTAGVGRQRLDTGVAYVGITGAAIKDL